MSHDTMVLLALIVMWSGISALGKFAQDQFGPIGYLLLAVIGAGATVSILTGTHFGF